MTTAAPPVQEITIPGPQKAMRDWMREWSKDRPTVDPAGEELRQAFIDRFGEDVEFQGQLWNYVLDEMVPAEARRVFRNQRRVVMGGEEVTRVELERRAATDSRWSRWLAHRESVTGKGHVRLPDMTKEDILSVISDRKSQVRGELTHIAFLTELAKKMRPEQTVEERFKPEEIEAIRARINKTKETAV